VNQDFLWVRPQELIPDLILCIGQWQPFAAVHPKVDRDSDLCGFLAPNGQLHYVSFVSFSQMRHQGRAGVIQYSQ
jgi:hypothetical protein